MAPGLQHFPKAIDAELFQYNEHKDIQIGDLHSRFVTSLTHMSASTYSPMTKQCR